MLDTGRMSLEEFREAMKDHALEIIEEMEEDHLNPVAAFLEQMLSRRAADEAKTQIIQMVAEVWKENPQDLDIIDGNVVSDKGLKVTCGTCVVQVGKRKFARVTLSA